MYMDFYKYRTLLIQCFLHKLLKQTKLGTICSNMLEQNITDSTRIIVLLYSYDLIPGSPELYLEFKVKFRIKYSQGVGLTHLYTAWSDVSRTQCTWEISLLLLFYKLQCTQNV